MIDEPTAREPSADNPSADDPSADDLSADDLSAGEPPALPRWVKLLAIGTTAAVLLVLVAMLLLGGEHGPGMHGG